MTTFGNGECIIYDDQGDTIGQVPCPSKAVYKVVHDRLKLTCTTEHTVSWTELYHQIGHISPGVAKQLAEKNLVTRVCINTLLGNDPL